MEEETHQTISYVSLHEIPTFYRPLVKAFRSCQPHHHWQRFLLNVSSALFSAYSISANPLYLFALFSLQNLWQQPYRRCPPLVSIFSNFISLFSYGVLGICFHLRLFEISFVSHLAGRCPGYNADNDPIDAFIPTSLISTQTKGRPTSNYHQAHSCRIIVTTSIVISIAFRVTITIAYSLNLSHRIKVIVVQSAFFFLGSTAIPYSTASYTPALPFSKTNHPHRLLASMHNRQKAISKRALSSAPSISIIGFATTRHINYSLFDIVVFC